MNHRLRATSTDGHLAAFIRYLAATDAALFNKLCNSGANAPTPSPASCQDKLPANSG